MAAMPHIHFCSGLQCAYIEQNIPNCSALPSHQIENSKMSSASFSTHCHIIQHDICGVTGTRLGNLTRIPNRKLSAGLNVGLHLEDGSTGGFSGLKRLKPSAT